VALDADVLEQIRDHVGSTPDDDTVETAYNRFTGEHVIEQTALSILQRRLADFEADYAEFQLDGDAKWNAGKNIEALTKKIAALEAVCGTGASTLTTGRLVRGTTR
jgi:hypothetical protein